MRETMPCVIIIFVLLLAWGSLGWWVPAREKRGKHPEFVQGYVIECTVPGQRYFFSVPESVVAKAVATGDYKFIRKANHEDEGNLFVSNSRFDGVWIPGGFIEDGVEYQDERLNG